MWNKEIEEDGLYRRRKGRTAKSSLPILNWVRRFVGNPTETQQYVDKENKVGIEMQQVWTFSIDGRAMTMTMTMTRLWVVSRQGAKTGCYWNNVNWGSTRRRWSIAYHIHNSLAIIYWYRINRTLHSAAFWTVPLFLNSWWIVPVNICASVTRWAFDGYPHI